MKILAILLTLLAVLAPSAFAQPAPFWHSQALPSLPPPVSLPIINLRQETAVWCWAAVAQQVIHWRVGPNGTPRQCALVSAGLNLPPMYCCMNPCTETGTFPQIAYLIGSHTQRPSSYVMPTNPMALYHTLLSQRPVLLQLATGLSTTHVVLLVGMHFEAGPWGVEAFLHINDPMSHYTTPVPYSAIYPIWMDAMVVN